MNDLESLCECLFEAEQKILDDIKTHLDDGYITIFDEITLLAIRSFHRVLNENLGGEFDGKI